MKLAPARIGRQAVIAAATGVLLLAAPIAVTADTGQAPAAPKPGASAEARTAPSSGLAAAGVNCDGGYHCLFFYNVSSSKKQYFDSVDHFNGDRFSGGNGHGNGVAVDNNSWAASNSSTTRCSVSKLFDASPPATERKVQSLQPSRMAE